MCKSRAMAFPHAVLLLGGGVQVRQGREDRQGAETYSPWCWFVAKETES